MFERGKIGLGRAEYMSTLDSKRVTLSPSNFDEAKCDELLVTVPIEVASGSVAFCMLGWCCLLPVAVLVGITIYTTEGVASGYRVLALNFLTTEGGKVLPPCEFNERRTGNMELRCSAKTSSSSRSPFFQPIFVMQPARFAGGIELVGGSLVAVGLAGSIAAFVASGEMTAAYFCAHAPIGFWPIQNGAEWAVLYCFFFLYVAAKGSGRFSLDSLIHRRRAALGARRCGAQYKRLKCIVCIRSPYGIFVKHKEGPQPREQDRNSRDRC